MCTFKFSHEKGHTLIKDGQDEKCAVYDKNG